MQLKEYVSPSLSSDKGLSANYSVQQNEINLLNNDIQDIIKQCFVDTATWGLDYWDKFTGLNTQKYDMQLRRNLIKSKLIMQPPFTKKMLTDLLNNFVESSEVIERTSEYTFDIILKTKVELRENLNFIINQIEISKPAHLDYKIIIDYLTELTIKCNFINYNSEELRRCGTIDVNGNVVDINMGRSYKEYVTEKFNRYISEEIVVTGPNIFIENIQGRSYKEKILDNIKQYFSETFLICSENTLVKDVI